MKKILSIILITALAVSLVSCSKKETADNTDEPIKEIVNEDISDETENTEDSEDADMPEENKAPDALNSKPQKEEVQTKPQEQKPQQNPVETKPQESADTLGGILVNEFKKIASSHSDALSVAQALSESKAIKFSGMAAPVEAGYLTGFTDKEIHGFTEGAMFAPMIGTIPFVGYVFVTDNASELTETLRKNADLRWNLCTEAEEMHTAVSGNKVFFVMCPKTMEE